METQQSAADSCHTLPSQVLVDEPPKEITPQQKHQPAKPPEEVLQKCIRQACNKPPVKNMDWDEEYCSQMCVILHCRAVFESFQNDGTETTDQPMEQTTPTTE